MRRSEAILQVPEFSFNRSVYKSMGFCDEQLKKPIIGIANSWSELVPGHFNLRSLAEHVKHGIYAAGGTAVEFGFTGACDGTAQGCVGMNYILPSRELIANDIEVMVQAHQLDAVVMLGSCDKIMPGMLMAAARLDIPAIILPGGPMMGGKVFDGRKSDLTSVSEAVGMLKAGKLSQAEFSKLEEAAAPTCGSCSFYGTANTMCCLAEALGMTLPNGALVPAVYAERTRLAYRTGMQIMDLVERNITARQIINEASIENAIRVLMATSGSTNAVMHLTAMAAELDIPADHMMTLFDRLSDDTPHLAKVNPASAYNMEDFHHAGGIPQVLYELREKLNLDVMTVTGQTVGENISTIGSCPDVDRNCIKTVTEPFSAKNGVAVIRGNIAPLGAVTKPGAIHPDMHHFEGIAKVFNCEEDAEEAILAGEIEKGDVLVIRYEGPKGGPGMREMYKAMKYLYGYGLGKDTAIITDGRFSGTNNGCFVGHISPEAADGGVIAIIENGDKVVIDIPNKEVNLLVDEAEIQRRFESWQRPAKKYKKGYLALYERMALSASEGAGMKLHE